MPRKELIQLIHSKYGIKNAYGQVSKALETGKLRDVNGKIEFVPDDGE